MPKTNMIKLSVTIVASILTLITIICIYYHVKWKYIIYPRVEKTLEKKYNTKFKCVSDGLFYAESHHASPVLDFKINHYIITITSVDNPFLTFECQIDRDYKPYADNFLSIKQGYEASQIIRPVAQKYFSDYRMSCIMEKQEEASAYIPDLNVYIILPAFSCPDIEKIIAFADRIVKLKQDLKHEVRLHLAITDRKDYPAISEKRPKRIETMADYPYSHEFSLFFSSQMYHEQTADASRREKYISQIKNEYQEKIEKRLFLH